MTSQRIDVILRTLRLGPMAAADLATLLGAPTPSIRRSISVLRNRGYIIDDARDNNWTYRLVAEPSLTT